MHIIKRDIQAVAPIAILLGAVFCWQSINPALLRAGLWATAVGGLLWLGLRVWRTNTFALPVASLPLTGFMLWQAIRSLGVQPFQPAAASVQFTAGALLAFLWIDDSLESGWLAPRHWENALLLLAVFVCAAELLLALVWQMRWAAVSGDFFSFAPVGYRATGLLLRHPNVLSGFINLALPIGVIRIFRETTWQRRSLWVVALAELGGAQLLTSSRGGWLAGGLGVMVTLGLIVLLWERASAVTTGRTIRLRNRLRRLAPAIGLVTLLLLPVAWLGYRQLTRVGHAPLSSARAVVWSTGWTIFMQSPWLGAGPGAYPMLSPALTQTPPAFDANHAHNLWLQVASEEGLIGEALLLLLIVMILLPGLKRLRASGPSDIRLAAYLGSGTALLAQHVVDYLFGVELYALAAVSLLVLYLREVQAPRWGVGPRVWLAFCLIVWGSFIAPGAWLLRGSEAYWRGVQAASAGDWDAAELETCRASVAAPDHPLYAQECGLAATVTMRRSSQTAVKALTHAEEISPAWPPLLANLAVAEWQSGDGEAALASLQQAALSAPRSSIFWLSLSRLRTCQGELEAASLAYRRAIESNPWLAGPDPAAIAADEPIGYRPEQSLSPSEQFRWWALEALARGDLDTASLILRLGENANPGDANLYAAEARTHAARGDLPGARRSLETALFIGRNWPYVEQTAAELFGIWGEEQLADHFAVKWAESQFQVDYSDKYFSEVYHASFLSIDLAPGLIRGGAAPDVLSRLVGILASPFRLGHLTPNQALAVDAVLDNQYLLGSCPP